MLDRIDTYNQLLSFRKTDARRMSKSEHININIKVTRTMSTHNSGDDPVINKDEIGEYNSVYAAFFFKERSGVRPFITLEFVEKNFGDLFINAE